MTFSFDESLSTDLDYIRHEIGDSISGAGPRPKRDNTNYTDERITALLGINSDRVSATIASLFEALAQEWARHNTNEREGDITQDAKQLPNFYLDLARLWRSKPDGGITDGVSSGVIALTRVDAWTGDDD